MRRALFVVAILATGCHNTRGPFEHRAPERVDDPLLSTREQQRAGRASLALPDESPAAGPASGVSLPGPHGR